MNNRDLFAELSSALVEAKEHSEGKLTLKTHQFTNVSELNISPDEIVNIRERFHMSRGVFARLLHTSSRTLENWEQGRAKPNAQAAVLIKLVEKYPDTLSRLANV